MSASTNSLGLGRQDYAGARSTLCPGCGHDAIVHQIISALWEMGLEPHRLAKLSGIGCSSKAPTYYSSRSWGFNSLHGRAAPLATGVALANRELKLLLTSGDGDSTNIGLGHFLHLIRRNVPVVYVLMNNGVYGLTKGQFSSTADRGSRLKHGEINPFEPVDPCALALDAGCGFVARSFAGNPKQLNQLLKAALTHRGTAILDVLSPCVSFNNHEGSTKSYKYVKEHELPLQELGFVPHWELETFELPPGETRMVDLPDGSRLLLKALHEGHNPLDKLKALEVLHASKERGEQLTGLIYLNAHRPDLIESMNLPPTPLARLPEAQLKPKPEQLEDILREFSRDVLFPR